MVIAEAFGIEQVGALRSQGLKKLLRAAYPRKSDNAPALNVRLQMCQMGAQNRFGETLDLRGAFANNNHSIRTRQSLCNRFAQRPRGNGTTIAEACFAIDNNKR